MKEIGEHREGRERRHDLTDAELREKLRIHDQQEAQEQHSESDKEQPSDAELEKERKEVMKLVDEITTAREHDKDGKAGFWRMVEKFGQQCNKGIEGIGAGISDGLDNTGRAFEGKIERAGDPTSKVEQPKEKKSEPTAQEMGEMTQSLQDSPHEELISENSDRDVEGLEPSEYADSQGLEPVGEEDVKEHSMEHQTDAQVPLPDFYAEWLEKHRKSEESKPENPKENIITPNSEKGTEKNVIFRFQTFRKLLEAEKEMERKMGCPPDEQIAHKFDRLIEEYCSDSKRIPNNGFKIAKSFKKWIKQHPSINEMEQKLLVEYCNYLEREIPATFLRGLDDICKQKGWKLLTNEFINSKAKVEVECDKGHIFPIRPNALLKQGCKLCLDIKRDAERKLRYKELKDICIEQGFTLLSPDYENVKAKVKVQCEKGHIWYPTPDNLKRGVTACGKCSIEKRLLKHRLTAGKELQENIRQRGGELLSEYINNHTRVRVKCGEGHIWEPRPYDLKHSTAWCPECFEHEVNQKRSQKVKKLRKTVEMRGGTVRWARHVGGRMRAELECENGHIWETLMYNILEKGSWCSECQSWRAERVCRNIFKAIFNDRFPKLWPEWLINDRGNRMELDGYNEDLKLAFEYQGRQHYQFEGFFNTDMSDLENRMENDKMKREMCVKNGVKLIEVPFTVKFEQMPNYIIKQCEKEGIKVPKLEEQTDFGEIINKAYRLKLKTGQSQIDDFASEEHDIYENEAENEK